MTEALRNPNRKVHRLFITEDALKKLNKDNQKINILKKVHIFYKSKKEIDNLCGKEDYSHQNIVAEIEDFEKLSLKEFIFENREKNLNFIALEEVTDPRNIGSIVRSAVSFKIDGIIVKERQFSNDSKLMYKAASGAIEYVNIFEVANINSTLKNLKEKNFWVYGFDGKAEKDFTEIDWKGNNILLFGSEGFGMHQHTSKYADFLVKIEFSKN